MEENSELIHNLRKIKDTLQSTSPLAKHLDRLTIDIEADDIKAWGQVNLLTLSQLFELSAKPTWHAQWLYRIEAFRNVGILIPLFYTWYAIWRAAEQYRFLLQQKPEISSQSFLILWQTGFGGNYADTLDIVARTDAIFLGILILLTIFVFWLRHQYENQHNKAQNELESLLLEAQLTVAEQNAKHPVEVVARLGDESQHLISSIKLIKDSLETQLKETRILAVENAKMFKTELEKLQEVAQKNQASAVALTGFTEQMRLSTEAFQGTIAGFSMIAKEIPKFNTELSENYRGLAKILTGLSQEQHQIIGTFTKTLDGLYLTSQSLGELSGSFSNGLKTLNQSSNTLNDTTKQILNINSSFRKISSELNDLSQLLQVSSNLLSERIPAGTKQQENASLKLEEASEKLRSATQGLEEVMKKLIPEIQLTLVEIKKIKLQAKI